MNFFKAMEALADGEKLKNVNWEVTQYIYVDEEDGRIKDQDHKFVGLAVFSSTTEDLWRVYEEPETLHCFYLIVLSGLQEGKKFRRKEWKVNYIFSAGKYSPILRNDCHKGESFKWNPTPDDLLAQDWIEVQL